MKFLSIYRPAPEIAGTPPTEEHMAEMGKLIEEYMKSGVLVTTGPLLPMSKGGARVRLNGDRTTVIDAPSETQERVGGYAILEVTSTAEAIELSKHFLKIAGGGETELRQMPDMNEAPAGQNETKQKETQR